MSHMEEEKTVTLRPVLALHGYAVDFLRALERRPTGFM